MTIEVMENLDDEEQVISSALWRNVCGNPSANSWAKYRRSVGLNRDNKKQKLTRKEAYLLLVRANLREICERLEIEKPKDKDIEDYLPNSPLFSIAAQYANALSPNELDAVMCNAIRHSSLSGEAILTLLATLGEVANRPLGERQAKRLIAQAGLGTILKRKIYSHSQVQRFIRAASGILTN
jgi:uncharacterized protein YnzC (UPF0291/DUF896 family)